MPPATCLSPFWARNHRSRTRARCGSSGPATVCLFSHKLRRHSAPKGDLLEDKDFARRFHRRSVGRLVRASGSGHLHVHTEGGSPCEPAALWRRATELRVFGRSSRLDGARGAHCLRVSSGPDRRQRRCHLHTDRSPDSARRRLLPVLETLTAPRTASTRRAEARSSADRRGRRPGWWGRCRKAFYSRDGRRRYSDRSRHPRP